MRFQRTAKITLRNLRQAGELSETCYTVSKLNGLVEITIPGFGALRDRVVLVGDKLTHAEAKRLSAVKEYDVTTVE